MPENGFGLRLRLTPPPARPTIIRAPILPPDVPIESPRLRDQNGRLIPAQWLDRSLAFTAPAGTEQLVLEASPAGPPYPRVQVDPQPDGALVFCVDGQPVAHYHHDPRGCRPFLHPLAGPGGVSLTAMGLPPDPDGRRHLHGLWIGHRDVAAINFWEDRPDAGQVESQAIAQVTDGPVCGALTALLLWRAPSGEPLLAETRRMVLWPLPAGALALDLELEWHTIDRAVRLGRTPFGMLALRVARSMAVVYGGRITAATGATDEAGVTHSRARWCDYSGPIGADRWAGLAILDHEGNPRHPCYWHVRDDGWMGAAVTFEKELDITRDEPLRLHYRLITHDGGAEPAELDVAYEDYVDPPRVIVESAGSLP